ncbi:LysR family transcriptional regulator [Nesterenkonia suensis]
METRRLEYFLILVSEGSYKRAAARLFISQPALSQQIKKLEQTLGVQLIDRRAQGFTLTEAGQHVFDQSHRVLDEVSQLTALASGVSPSTVGRLRLGIVPGLFWGSVTRVIRDFTRRYPAIDISMRKGRTAALHEQLSSHQLDVVISYSPPTDPGAQSAIILREEYAAVVPDDHALALRRSLRMEDLRDETFFIIPRQVSPSDYDAVITACRQADFSPRISTHGTPELSVQENYFSQMGAISTGLGVAIIPLSFSVFQEAFGGIRFVPLIASEMEVRARLGWNADARSSELQAFLSHFKTSLI